MAHGSDLPDPHTSLKSYCKVWRCALGHCPVVGGNCVQSSAVHRVWHGVAKWSDSTLFKIPFTLYKASILPAPKQPQTITLHHHAWRWRQALLQHLFTCSASHKCSSVWSKHLTPNTKHLSITLFSNLPLSNICVLLPILIFYFYWPLCLEGQHPTSSPSPLHCGHWDWCIAGTI